MHFVAAIFEPLSPAQSVPAMNAQEFGIFPSLLPPPRSETDLKDLLLK